MGDAVVVACFFAFLFFGNVTFAASPGTGVGGGGGDGGVDT